jgi:hypothetical protein
MPLRNGGSAGIPQALVGVLLLIGFVVLMYVLG